MSNKIDASGISIETLAEILDAIVNGTTDVEGLKAIYGSDINVDSASPDGQAINIFALSKRDILELITDNYNSKDPDQAVGVALDALSQLCGITRKGGTYTYVAVDVTVDRSVNLVGLDDSDSPFTISDGNGNNFYLLESVSLSAGSTSLNFRAAEVGSVQVLIHTLTTQVTIVLGVTAVDNSTVPYSNGQDQETDAQLRVRRQASVALPAQGMLSGLYAGLQALDGVAEVVIYENTENTVDGDGVPAHSIWVIVDGGTAADIGEVIYKYRNAGCGMKGDETVVITQVDGSSYEVYYTEAVDADLYLEFTATSKTGASIDTDSLKTSIVAALNLGIHEIADITSITAIIAGINPDLIITDCQVSLNGSDWADSVEPVQLFEKFTLTEENITIS
jgi:uncharacterized phage protein gp47/JayE